MTSSASETLLQVLDRHCYEDPDRWVFSFCGEKYGYGWLQESSRRFATLLRERGLEQGDRVLMALPNGPEFFAAFYGALRAGVIAVPIFAESGERRIETMARVCDCRAIVLSSDVAAAAGRRPSGAVQPVLSVADSAHLAADGDLPVIGADDVAYLQYTSGSTGAPKGVQISHANLLANLQHIIHGMEITPAEVMVSWLPVYHDLGLVILSMVPFFLKARLVLLPTSLRHINSWLEAIAEHAGTFTAAPDFAYRLCLRHISDPGSYDLSSLRVALNAAEPVRASTLAEFEKRFGLENVMMPGYGLAEATVGVSMWKPGTPVRTDGDGLVSVGLPFPGVEVEVHAEGRRANPGERGEILVRSAATTRGYFRNPAATAELIRDRGFIATGDLGYLDEDGYIYVVARKKNIIIHGGRNLAPREIEEIIDALTFVRLAAAVGIDRGGDEGEQIYAFAEVREDLGEAESDLQQMAVRIVDSVKQDLGVRPARTYLLSPRAIPMTPNGKVRHLGLKESWTSGALKDSGAILFPDY